MTDLPSHLRFIDEPKRRPFYRYDPPRNVIDAGVLKMWTTKDKDEAIAPAPLTDEQIDGLVIQHAGYGRDNFYAVARAVERAHGIGASTKESNQ